MGSIVCIYNSLLLLNSYNIGWQIWCYCGAIDMEIICAVSFVFDPRNKKKKQFACTQSCFNRQHQPKQLRHLHPTEECVLHPKFSDSCFQLPDNTGLGRQRSRLKCLDSYHPCERPSLKPWFQLGLPREVGQPHVGVLMSITEVISQCTLLTSHSRTSFQISSHLKNKVLSSLG